MTEWLGKQILDGFLRQFQTKAGGTSRYHFLCSFALYLLVLVTSTRRYNAKLQMKWYPGLAVLKLRVLLTFSVYFSCLYNSGFITVAQLSRPTRQRLDAFVVCTPQQTLRVLLTRSRPYGADSVHCPHCRVQMFNTLIRPVATSLTRILLLDYFL